MLLIVFTRNGAETAFKHKNGLYRVFEPTMCVADIRSIAELTHKHGAILMVDNTFATPFHIQPLKFGADIVAHSTTKYLGGMVCNWRGFGDEKRVNRAI